ncbi:hypothetical protein C8N43_1433 [Litoreibacter ponti]|uniref:Uncharacterized protein n=1 Tax=Litoreibacter ponti TaxID=1510457 RepID=A0A2T6BL33_9RHOB|nr:hypothetical protein [Litoreibacter ponti]PTX56771.1 hypothetical protein C8N43_1433 [Litoreibacter ponti]
MTVVLLIGIAAGAGIAWLFKGSRSLWWPTLGFAGMGVIGAVAFMVAMESATLAQLHNGEMPLGASLGGLAVLVSLSGLIGIAVMALRRLGGARKGRDA